MRELYHEAVAAGLAERTVPVAQASLAVVLQHPINVESHPGESIIGDSMTKAWRSAKQLGGTLLEREHFR